MNQKHSSKALARFLFILITLLNTAAFLLLVLPQSMATFCRASFAGQKPGVCVIGGKDGPTAIYCSTSFDPQVLDKLAGRAACLSLFASILLFFVRRKKRY